MTSSPIRARWAISAQFFTNGVITASLLPRLPEVKTAFALSDTAYGFLVIAMPFGSIAAATLAGPLIRRFGALRVAALGTVALAFLLAGAGFSPWAWLFALFMAAAGFSDAVLDTGQNVHGMAVERWYGRSIINSMHAAWSLGATLGGVIGAASASAGLPLGWQLLAGAVVWSGAAIAAALAGAVPERFVRAAEESTDDGAPPSPADGDPRAAAASGGGEPAGGDEPAGGCTGPVRRTFPWKLFLPLAVLAICGTLVEDIANNWVTLFLNRETGASIGLAGMGFATMLGAQFVGRILGDPMTDRWGRSAVARLGGLLIATGGMAAVLAAWPWLAILGFAVAGFGTATLVPAAFAASDSLPGVPHGTGVAMVGWWMRLGFLLTSPAVGAIGDTLGLRAGLAILLVAGLLAAAIAHRRAGNAGHGAH